MPTTPIKHLEYAVAYTDINGDETILPKASLHDAQRYATLINDSWAIAWARVRDAHTVSRTVTVTEWKTVR